MFKGDEVGNPNSKKNNQESRPNPFLLISPHEFKKNKQWNFHSRRHGFMASHQQRESQTEDLPNETKVIDIHEVDNAKQSGRNSW